GRARLSLPRAAGLHQPRLRGSGTPDPRRRLRRGRAVDPQPHRPAAPRPRRPQLPPPAQVPTERGAPHIPGARRALNRAARAAAAAARLAAACAPPAAAAPVVDYLGTYVWAEADEDFGGFSGLELTADGSGFTALSDRGTLRWGSIHRDRQGRIAELTTACHARLQDSSGTPLKPGYLGDAEGLAIDRQGRIFVSFEGLDRIARYDDPDSPADPIPRADWFKKLRRNLGLEALAITDTGDLLTI